jgi:elongator complex protein 5
VFLSFETLRSPPGVDDFLFCAGRPIRELENGLLKHARQPSGCLVVFDTIHPLLSQAAFNLPAFLSQIMSPATSILALCHRDIPFSTHDPYQPDPLTQLRYLATTILTTHALAQVVAAKRARDCCEAEPPHGLAECVPGALVGILGGADDGGAATVLEMEHRRRSGRAVRDWFVVEHGPAPAGRSHRTSSSSSSSASAAAADALGGAVKAAGSGARGVVRLEEHPAYPRPEAEAEAEDKVGGGQQQQAGLETTFNLGLSEKERRDREGVRLPFFDAQNEGGIGDGGRILYDMGVEDDFDDEEDEI